MIHLPENRPALMGILNVTPDSFSDGGRYGDVQSAVDAARRMVDKGADLIDVGGESTRPGSDEVPEAEEIRRTQPVVSALARLGIDVSVDTRHPQVALAALESGAKVVNDVSGLRDEQMRAICASHGCTVCLMHMQGEPKTMQENPSYPNGVVSEVRASLLEAGRQAEADGILRERIWLDPGIGFGKTLEDNLKLIRATGEFASLGYPVLIGVSRKSFIGRIARGGDGPAPVDDRLEGTLAVQVLAQAWGAKVVRAHDVRAARRAIDAAAAVLAA